MASTVSQVRPIPMESSSEKMEMNSGDESAESPSKLDESSEDLSTEEKPKSADESEGKLSEPETELKKVGDKTKKRTKVSSDHLKSSDLDANPAEQVKSEGHRRERKQVERFAIATPKATEKATVIPEGKGTKLGEIPYIVDQINRQRAADLEYLHRFFFGKRGSSSEIKKHLRLFSGFDFDESSPEFQKKKAQALKWTPKVLKPICDTLGLQKKGVKEQIVDRILEFSLSPSDTGAKIKSKAKRKSSSSSTKRKSSSSGSKSGSRTPSSAKTAKKEVTKKKSEESEEDEHDDDDDAAAVVVQKKTKTAKPVESDDEPPRKRSREGPARQAAARKSYKDESDSDGEEDEDEPPPKKTKPKAVSQKKPKKPVKVISSEEEEDDGSSEPQSDSDHDRHDDDDDQPKKAKLKTAKVSPSKPKSSSKGRSDSDSEDSEKDDKEASKTPDKSSVPSDDELKKVVTGLMKTANLKKVTMKKMLQEVQDKFPGVDLAGKKSYIKEAVEEILEGTT